MKNNTLIFLLVFTTCCTNKFQSNCKNKVNVEFINIRDEFSTVTFSNSQDSILLDVKENNKPLCFSGEIRTDGNYIIKINGPIKDTIIYWGYYSNGTPSEKLIKIILEKNSINIKSEEGSRSFY